MSNELLEKAVAANTTVSTGMNGGSITGSGIHVGATQTGGLLNPEQSARFQIMYLMQPLSVK